MKHFKNIDEILDFAMQSEQEAVDFYSKMAAQAKTKDMQEIFEQFAQEEVSHKARLKEIKTNGTFEVDDEKVADLQIADYTVKVKPKPDMDYQDALVVAMQKEKAAFRLYSNLAKRAPNNAMKELFEALAMEESKHKLRFELEYDEHILREN
ncbi:MAG TPA: ferritin family protein [Salinivirga sp.]|uniref:ferritin family protein n=1 Tax=Salinivirga sp. TaxID=1970192 RepID=UPI002B49B8D5|nr:ferritin family protein [Salinivirga sp.]HKK58036.1 ferritin family protein [Salinivirga sp.]